MNVRVKRKRRKRNLKRRNVIGGRVIKPLGRGVEIVFGVLAVMVHPRRTGSLGLPVHA